MNTETNHIYRVGSPFDDSATERHTIAPDIDPESLLEEPFELEGFLYTFADIVKVENTVEKSKVHTEVVTVEPEKDDLAVILAMLEPTMEYDDGEFQGTLALDHTSITTAATGYTTKYGKTTETKVIGGLDRNDMSYVPATTIKNGRTLKLSDVDWQVTGTDLVGEVLMPSQYQAVATYTASTSWQAATGYVTTAEYVGTVDHEGVESITYTVTYLGEESVEETGVVDTVSVFVSNCWLFLVGGLILLALVARVLYVRHVRNADSQSEETSEPEDEQGENV